jgi:hypothetical protein
MPERPHEVFRLGPGTNYTILSLQLVGRFYGRGHPKKRQHTAKNTCPKMVERVQALRIALGYEGSSSQIARLRQAWTLLGRDEKTQQAAIREAFDLERGFPDHLLVPEIPNTNGYGFVILLRSISSVHSSDLFKTEVDAKINDRPDAFHRIGRFSDSLRFSVAQKLAFLFSRIGMSSEFEEACEAATDLLIDSVYAKSGE